ncbi:hypothetical protein, partial [Streptomyces sp. G-G2]|uniref:hypothetical protein n=1 Tax=Streptomyces sp. G-G2 TaxID=3046201 RepID=UPI0024B991EF
MTRTDGPATTTPRPETAWPVENVLFSAALIARRLPWADLPARALGLDALTREALTRRLMTHLRGSRSGRPVRLRTPFGTFLVPLTGADAASLLGSADRAGVLGPASGLASDGRRYGLSPHVSPPGTWDVLTEEERDGLSVRVAEHLTPVLAARREDRVLDRADWHEGMLRLSRRVVVGPAATEDTLLSTVVAAATDAAGSRAYEARAAAVRRRLEPYLADPVPDSLAGRLLARGDGGPEAHLAVAHALALVSTATGTSALQALALLGAGTGDGSAERNPSTVDEAAAWAVEQGSEQGVEQGLEWGAQWAVEQALDRYPPLAATVHPVRAPLAADGLTIEAGTEILDLRMLVRRGEGERADPASALCPHPSGCAGARFAALVGREVVRGVTAEGRPVLRSPRFTADRLPESLDPGSVVVALVPFDGPGDGSSDSAPASAYGCAPGSYGAPAQADADRLDRHAESLARCAADAGWNASAAAERFRMVLLGHADRCAGAADDVRRAARRLS